MNLSFLGFKKPQKQPFSILIIDDSIGSINILKKQAENFFNKIDFSDYVIDTFTSYESFLENRKNDYHVAVTDWNLSNNSETNGGSVIADLKSMGVKSDSIAIFSGMDDDSAKIALFSFKENVHYIHKGSKKQRTFLSDLIERNLNTWLLKNQ